jgi:hypothetical protein
LYKWQSLVILYWIRNYERTITLAKKKNKKFNILKPDFEQFEARLLVELGARHAMLNHDIGLRFDRSPIAFFVEKK